MTDLLLATIVVLLAVIFVFTYDKKKADAYGDSVGGCLLPLVGVIVVALLLGWGLVELLSLVNRFMGFW